MSDSEYLHIILIDLLVSPIPNIKSSSLFPLNARLYDAGFSLLLVSISSYSSSGGPKRRLNLAR